MDLIMLVQQGKLIELRHKGLGLNMTNRDTQSQVHSEKKARHAKILHCIYGFFLGTK